MKRAIKIGDRFIGKPQSCLVVAEAGSNHNGDLELGKKLIESAKECGCGAIKFQAFKTENLVTRNAKKGDYQKGRSIGESQFEMLKGLELNRKQHSKLVGYADSLGISIFYSVFDKESADLIDELGVGIFKLGSGELTNIPLVKYIARKNKPLILSTGMASDEEIADAVRVFMENGNKQLVLMNCSTGYPCVFRDVNLRRMKYLENKFGTFCGNSDHSEGVLASILAAALGAVIVEKHFTLDKALPGPDHRMSIDPKEMKQMCSLIRSLEKRTWQEKYLFGKLKKLNIEVAPEEIEVILGREKRVLSGIERKQRIWARKSLVATRNILKNEVFSNENMAIKRPEKGILPKDYDSVIGRRARVIIKKEAPITWEMVE